jgi:3-deoxy-D-manno-octulosonic-acid transferase
MNGALALAYAAAGAAAEGATALATRLRGDTKLLRTLRGRRGLANRYAAWAASGRDLRRPLLWVHASSVGEGLQARPLLELLRQQRPELQIAYTHFSSSAVRLAQTLRDTGLVDFADFLPWDTTVASTTALDALAPRALVFSKLDLWPVLIGEAAARGVRLALVSGTLPAQSARRSRLGVALLGSAYARLDAVGAIDADDAARLRAIGVRPNVLTVTGDTRYDQVWSHAQRLDRQSSLLTPWRDSRGPIVVAGSTWPSDERVLLAAWLAVRARVPTARLIVAPHEPTAGHLEPIEQWASTHGIALTRLARVDQDGTASEVVLVDRVGVLADLYGVADVAFVGGGFHGAGLHSILEPAVFGVPVIFGPQHASSRDAGALLAADGGAAAADEDALRDVLTAWLVDDRARRRLGANARQFVERGLGAAARSADLVRPLLQ